MDKEAIPIIAVFGLTFGMLFLTGFVYALYRLGVEFAKVAPRTWRLQHGILAICLAWAPIAAFALLLPAPAMMTFSMFFGIMSVGAYPCCIGFTAGRYFREKEENRQYSRNVDRWLADWECEPDEELAHMDVDLKDLPENKESS